MSGSSDASSIPTVPPDSLVGALGSVGSSHVAQAHPVKRCSLDPIRISFSGSDPMANLLQLRGEGAVGDSLGPNVDGRTVAYEDVRRPVGSEIPINYSPHASVKSRKVVFFDKVFFIDTEYGNGDHVFVGSGGPFFRDDAGKLHISGRSEGHRRAAYLLRSADDYGWTREVHVAIESQRNISNDLYDLLEQRWAMTEPTGGSDYIIDAARACRTLPGSYEKNYTACVTGPFVDEGKHRTAHAFERFLVGLAVAESDAQSMVYALDRVRWNQISQSSEWDFNAGSWWNPGPITGGRFADGSQRQINESGRRP